MKAWLWIPFSILALLAMFATMMPGTLWACPMNGRVDTASRVCALPIISGEMPCARVGGKCCKPLSVPSSQTDDDSGKPQVFAAVDHVSFSFSFATPVVTAAPFIGSRIEVLEAPALCSFLARMPHAPPPFWTSHRPISVAGRAPPVG